jgi:hypothetical protein
VGVAFAVVLAAVAHVNSSQFAAAAEERTVQVGCQIHTTDNVDYIFPNNTHRHHRFAGRPATATSTYAELQANTNTSCLTPEYTPEDWFPKIWHGPNQDPVSVRKVNVYYRGDGGVTTAPIPDGAQLVGNESNGDVDFRCGGEGDPVIEEAVDLYGCTKDQFRIRITFPECWDGNGLEPQHFSEPSGTRCPAAFPERLNEARMAIHYDTPSRGVQKPIVVSSNQGRSPISTMHGDIFFTVRNSYYTLLEDCGITAPLSGEMPAECRTGEAA